jgi:hypothetical protein
LPALTVLLLAAGLAAASVLLLLPLRVPSVEQHAVRGRE